MSLLISALIFLIVLAVVIYIATLLPIPQPWKNILIAVLCLIALLIFLSRMGLAF